MRVSAYFDYPSVLSLNKLKLHKAKKVENTFIQYTFIQLSWVSINRLSIEKPDLATNYLTLYAPTKRHRFFHFHILQLIDAIVIKMQVEAK